MTPTPPATIRVHLEDRSWWQQRSPELRADIHAATARILTTIAFVAFTVSILDTTDPQTGLVAGYVAALATTVATWARPTPYTLVAYATAVALGYGFAPSTDMNAYDLAAIVAAGACVVTGRRTLRTHHPDRY